VETEGVIRFIMRGRASVATLAPDDLVAPRDGDVLELTRGQETELPQALKWQVARADEDYDAALVEARRITVDTTRPSSRRGASPWIRRGSRPSPSRWPCRPKRPSGAAAGR
jgi:hypothetical protein